MHVQKPGLTVCLKQREESPSKLTCVKKSDLLFTFLFRHYEKLRMTSLFCSVNLATTESKKWRRLSDPQ